MITYVPQDFEQDEIRASIKTLVGEDYEKWFQGFEIRSIQDRKLEFFAKNSECAAHITAHFSFQIAVAAEDVLKMTVTGIAAQRRSGI